MSYLENLSDGIKDGFVLFHIRNGKLCSVLLTRDQAISLNISLKIVFHDKPATIVLAEREIIEGYLERDGESGD